MLARGTEAMEYEPMAEEAGSACDCRTNTYSKLELTCPCKLHVDRNGSFESIATQKICTVNQIKQEPKGHLTSASKGKREAGLTMRVRAKGPEKLIEWVKMALLF